MGECKEMERWLVLGLYSGYSMLMGACWCVFSTIPIEAEDFYGVGSVAVSLFELCFMAAYVLTCVPSSWLLNRSLRRTLQGAALLMAVGVTVRLAAQHHYAVALLGQIIISLGNCVSMASCSTVAELWFPPHEALLATAVASMANCVGFGLQLLVSAAVRDVSVLLEIQTALCLAEALLLCLFFKPDPVHPEASVARGDLKTYAMKWRSMGFLLLSGAAFGAVNAFLGLLYRVLEPSGYSSLETGFVGFALSLSGVVGGVGSTLILAKCRFYTRALQFYLLIGIISSIGLCFAVLSFPAMVVVSGIYGFGVIGFLPLAIRAAVEDASIIDPSVPANVIFLVSQGVGLGQSAVAVTLQHSTHISALYSLALFTTLTFGLFLALYQVDLSSDPASEPLKDTDG